MAFISSLRTLRTKQDHGLCQERYKEVGGHCVAGHVHTKILPRHVTADYDCPLLGPQKDEIEELLQDGYVPSGAISLPEDDGELIEILFSGERFEKSEREICTYLALSHV